MKLILDFMGQHPILTVILFILTILLLEDVFSFYMKAMQ